MATADALDIGVDGVLLHRCAHPRTGAATWPFDALRYLRLKTAIGGDLGGTVDDRFFSVAMQIDLVRVYPLPG